MEARCNGSVATAATSTHSFCQAALKMLQLAIVQQLHCLFLLHVPAPLDALRACPVLCVLHNVCGCGGGGVEVDCLVDDDDVLV